MNAISAFCHEDDLGYECPGVRQAETHSERLGSTVSRNVTGQQRASRQSRYSRRPSPQRMSGSHRRGNKRYGI